MKKNFENFLSALLGLPRIVKRFIVLFVDLILCCISVWLAYYLRLGEIVYLFGGVILAFAVSVGIAIPIFILSGLYRAIFRFTGWSALLTIARAITIYGLVYAIIFTIIGIEGVPRTVGIIQPILLLLLVGGVRVFVHFWINNQYLSILKKASRPRVLIYGAGTAGRELASAIYNSPEFQLVGFLDDDTCLHGQILNGLPIYDPRNLSNLVSALKISQVLLSIPSIGQRRRSEILSKIRHAHVAVRALPSLTDLAQGKVSIADLRELDINDLLYREPVIADHTLLAMSVRGKVVMVTGAGGSIGGELSRQILSIGPNKLLLIEQSEYALYNIYHELEENLSNPDTKLFPLLASVQDKERMLEIMSTWNPYTVYHAAAYKHVPLVEHNVAEGIKNNVFGTLHLAQTAAVCGVSNFVLISSDKAVRPTNIMGASKRISEIILQALAANQITTRFSMVRFGNVLGSSGSVVPRFRQQINKGGPITLTHPDITRYFMTISEAAQLVIQAGAMTRGGDVFVLDMGEQVKVIDLAKKMIELSGLTIKNEQNPDGDIEIEITGLRPGEKLYEELLIGNNPMPTSHSRIMKANEEFTPWGVLESQLNTLEAALNMNDISKICLIMKNLVAGYSPGNEIVDWVYVEKNLIAT